MPRGGWAAPGEPQTTPSSGTAGIGHEARRPAAGRQGGPARHPGPTQRQRPGVRVSLRRNPDARGLAAQGPRQSALCRGPGEARQPRALTAVSPTLPVARRPQSRRPPLCCRQRLAGPQREPLGEVKVAAESGYTQQKLQPSRLLTPSGQGPRAAERRVGLGLPGANRPGSGATQGAAPQPAPAVAPARAGLGLWSDVHRSHGSGSPCAQLPLCWC
jgi:hypothetical protein